MNQKKFNIRFFSTVVLIWAADFLTKYWAVSALDLHIPVQFLGDILQFTLIYNTGGVFGILQDNALTFHILTGLAIIFLVIYYAKAQEDYAGFHIAIRFILGGAFGNFTDRFFRPGVVDFIDMGIGSIRWPTYNIADSFITIGAIILAVTFFILEKKELTQINSPKVNEK